MFAKKRKSTTKTSLSPKRERMRHLKERVEKRKKGSRRRREAKKNREKKNHAKGPEKSDHLLERGREVW